MTKKKVEWKKIRGKGRRREKNSLLDDGKGKVSKC